MKLIPHINFYKLYFAGFHIQVSLGIGFLVVWGRVDLLDLFSYPCREIVPIQYMENIMFYSLLCSVSIIINQVFISLSESSEGLLFSSTSQFF